MGSVYEILSFLGNEILFWLAIFQILVFVAEKVKGKFVLGGNDKKTTSNLSGADAKEQTST
ncbi:unnamed protein product, partial [Amoebophrya sp. A25]|eukprot:GSA25T00002323001.1